MAKAKIKRWGNSLGLVIPRETVEAMHLSENEEVEVEIKKPQKITDLLGILKGKKIEFTESDRLDVRN